LNETPQLLVCADVNLLGENRKHAKFKAALRKYLHTHSLYSVDEFFMCKDDL